MSLVITLKAASSTSISAVLYLLFPEKLTESINVVIIPLTRFAPDLFVI